MINALTRKFASGDGGAGVGHSAAHPNLAMIGKRVNSNSYAFPAGINPVGAELQRKFAAGIDFNMKIVIRGDRNTGKTALWRRLQGLPFVQEKCDAYTQTEEIQVASITWNYRARDFVVKLDVWDVVDKGRKEASTEGGGLKFVVGRKGAERAGQNSADVPTAVQEAIGKTACDASMVNVYNGCDGVVMMFDVSRDWTWAYVRRELPSVPSHIPVLVLANKMDMVEPNQPLPCTIEECLQFLRVFNERSREASAPSSSSTVSTSCCIPVRFAKASMKKAQGLKYVYNFFNLPFLFLQRTFLNNAIEANIKELRIASDELDILAKAEGQNTEISRQRSAESAEGRSRKSGDKKSKEGGNWEEDDDGEEEDEEEEDWGEEVEKGEGRAEKEGKKGTSTTRERRQRRRGKQKSAEVDLELSSSSSSSEGANPHVSVFLLDIEQCSEE